MGNRESGMGKARNANDAALFRFPIPDSRFPALQ